MIYPVIAKIKPIVRRNGVPAVGVLRTSVNQNIIALAVKDIIKFAEDVDKPIVLEDLSFVEKKKSLISGFNKKYNSMISSFAYNKILTNVQARALDKGIEVIEVNPAYTSIIGRYKYQGHRKLTTHQAAAYVIARRGMYCTVISTVKKDKIVTKRIINKENRISPKLEKHYPYPLPDWTKVGEGSFSFWSKMKQAEKSYRNKTPNCKKVEVHLVSPGESSHPGDACVKN